MELDVKALLDKNPKVDREKLEKDQAAIERATGKPAMGAGYRLGSPYGRQTKMPVRANSLRAWKRVR